MTLGVAMYFQLVTMTSIGYGDIYPTDYIGRILISILIIIYTLIFARFVSEILTIVNDNEKKVKKLKELKDHTVVFGNMFEFPHLAELFINNFYAEIYHKKSKFVKSRLVLINNTLKEVETNSVVNMEYLKYNYDVNNLIILNCNMKNNKWIKDTHLSKAKYLIVFFVRNYQYTFNNEYIQNFTSILSNINAFFPLLKIYASIDSKYLVKELKLLRNVRITKMLSLHKIRKKLMGISVENEGFAVLFLHLITPFDYEIDSFLKTIQFEITNPVSKALLLKYTKSLKTEVSCVYFPACLVGRTFAEASQIIYFHDFQNEFRVNILNSDFDKHGPAILLGLIINKN